MGDMKTPDFDDLLAAFDIPDATSLDAKESIHGNQDEGEGHLKHPEMCMDATVLIPHPVPTTDAPVVSVIVKNTSRQNSYENLVEKESFHLGHLLQNGFKSSAGSLETHPSSYPRLESSSVNGDCSRHSMEKIPVLYKNEKVSSLSVSMPQFSPISSPESEDIHSNGIDDRPKSAEASYFSSDSLFTSSPLPVLDNHGKPDASSLTCNERHLGSKDLDDLGCDGSSFKDDTVEHISETKSDSIQDCGTNAYPTPETKISSSRPCVEAHSSRLSSCLDALAALNAKKDPGGQNNSKDFPVTPKETMKICPKIPISPRSPRSPLEVVKRTAKQPDSPMSICSDSSGKASPAVAYWLASSHPTSQNKDNQNLIWRNQTHHHKHIARLWNRRSYITVWVIAIAVLSWRCLFKNFAFVSFKWYYFRGHFWRWKTGSLKDTFTGEQIQHEISEELKETSNTK